MPKINKTILGLMTSMLWRQPHLDHHLLTPRPILTPDNTVHFDIQEVHLVNKTTQESFGGTFISNHLLLPGLNNIVLQCHRMRLTLGFYVTNGCVQVVEQTCSDPNWTIAELKFVSSYQVKGGWDGLQHVEYRR